MINWQYFPKSDECPAHLLSVVATFEKVAHEIDSSTHSEQVSDVVLAIVRPGLQELGFLVETGKTANQKVRVPVLFGVNGKVDQAFEADAWDRQTGTVIEVEAGRAVTNYQFLKDLFQACMMHDVRYLAVAVRNTCRGSRDWERMTTFFNTMYASSRLRLPLEGLLAIGY